MILTTPRLNLRKLELADAPFILKLVNDPAWLRYIGDKGVRNLEDARRYIVDGPRKSYETYGFGLYLVELKEDNSPIGLCGLLKREELEYIDIGFAFMPDYRKKGLGYEATQAVMKEATESFSVKYLLALTALDNNASIKLLEKLGFQFERLIKMGREEQKNTRLFIWEREQGLDS